MKRPVLLGSSSPAPGSAVQRPAYLGRIAAARSGSRIGARARVGCRLGGREAGRARCRRACLWDGQPFRGAGFFGSCGSSLLLAENYNRTTTNNTTEAQSAQRLNGGGRNSLRLDDPCRLRASLARQPIDRGRCPGRCPRLVLLGPPPVGRADRASSQSAGRAFLLCCRRKPLASAEGICAEE